MGTPDYAKNKIHIANYQAKHPEKHKECEARYYLKKRTWLLISREFCQILLEGNITHYRSQDLKPRVRRTRKQIALDNMVVTVEII